MSYCDGIKLCTSTYSGYSVIHKSHRYDYTCIIAKALLVVPLCNCMLQCNSR